MTSQVLTRRGVPHPYFIARRSLQPAYNLLLRVALSGLNVGIDGGTSRSGERAALKALLGDSTHTAVVLDVGANIGNYTADVLATGASATVHCFEPSATAYTQLAMRFADLPNVVTHNIGLGDVEQALPLYADAAGSPIGSVFPRRLEYLGLTLRPIETATVRRLDRVFTELQLEQIDLLKLDVEGLELAVLRGAGDLLTSGAVRNIQFEFGGCNIDSRTFFRDFWELLNPRYRMYRIVNDGLTPIDRYDERLELFLTTNYVAIWR